ncbi:hypothetical protein SAMN02745146_2886 [Hymenobacter daecheongensis DSM 21074]|uniref:Uncharacterized protein n=1 Tax=Hymenobacter daecheongensis DSM 21074 TaxID=1121955 RepID=A0A1M6ILL3_9BACT|nr:hypothetical protein [Hymenobacter daecheongensis]SHJ35273.1 hypothetical protein SAMN02745146_2886 [Hymenobacter daecheongensis DSM 21074]
MKKILTAFLPALSLLALGSCASTSQLASTEDDGVYYSSKDRTTRNATASAAPSSGQSDARAAQDPNDKADTDAGADEATNPEYRRESGRASGSASRTEYYDDDYGYSARIRRFHQPAFRGFGYGYYDFAYVDPFWYGGGFSPYGWGPGYYGAFYDPFYDPFYGPYAYGGSFVNINIGFGRPYYNPWRFGGFGYGYGYGGFGGYRNGYRNGYYDGLNSGYSYGGRGAGTRTYYGPRRDGAREATSAAAGQGNAGRGRGRIEEGGIANPSGGGSSTGGFSNGGNGSGTSTVAPGRGRGRIVEGQSSGTAVSESTIRQNPSGQFNNASEAADKQLKEREMRRSQISEAEQPRLNTESSRGRWRVVENGGGTDAAPATTPQDYAQPRRGSYREMPQPQQAGGDDEQPQRVRQRVFGNADQPSRSREQPAEQPQRQRYSEPSRSEPSRTYSAPRSSGSDNSGGGGNSGGGSRGRGRMQ